MPALALGTEAPESDLMLQAPRPRSERLLTRGLFLRAYAFLGFIEAMLSMTVFLGFMYLHHMPFNVQPVAGDPQYQTAMTLTFAAIVFAQIGNGFACRSGHQKTCCGGMDSVE